MVVSLGLSGSSGSGKTTVARIFEKFCKAAVFCADKKIHDMYASDTNIVNLVKEYFPDSVFEGRVSRKELAKHFFAYSVKWQEFQSIVHEALLSEQRRFMMDSVRAGYDYVILDIPLLLEKGLIKACDFVIHVYVCRKFRQERLAARGISKGDMEFILSLQACEGKRRNFADFYINTGQSFATISSTVKDVVRNIDRILYHKVAIF